MPTFEQDRDRLRAKFVAELLALKKDPLDLYLQRINEITAIAPQLQWFLGHSFNRSIKVQTPIDADVNVKPTYPTMNYIGATRAYPHPDGQARVLPNVNEFLYNQVTANTLEDVWDKTQLYTNLMWAFTPETAPINDYSFKNTTYLYYQAQHIFHSDNLSWTPPTGRLDATGRRVRKFTTHVPKGWTVAQAILNVGGGNHTYNAIFAPSVLTYNNRKDDNSGYDTEDIDTNATVIRLYAEKSCVVFLFNQRYRMNVTGSLLKIWLLVTPTESGLQWTKLAEESA